ncbi:MAG: D-alanyl-D-alanine carboxypeptidase [Lachnospiraceae bacterium]|nr:D-alanyl-D-alanine carboxypeptidase [Lachnospiraceae bacterium]
MERFILKKSSRTGIRISVRRAITGILSAFLLSGAILFPLQKIDVVQAGEEVSVTSESVILMEMESGTVIAKKDEDKARPIASVTKIMTLLLILEAVDSGKIKLTDTVTVSEYAASMGGSQVFLEPGETQDVETMIKCISISSANDACVAMAEHLAGSEQAFVEKMNARAKELGMNHTTFHNCCGLDVSGHVSSAKDVALMSAELMRKHPSVKKYTTTWMDTIIHTTRRGSSEFGLANTNKLLKQYNGITGLKTGSTDEAKYCLSATAERNGVQLVAVVLAAPDTKTRFREAAALLDYGFAKCSAYRDDGADFPLTEIKIEKGVKSMVSVQLKEPFYHVFTGGEDLSAIEREVELPEVVSAPLKKGDVVGEYRYSLNGKTLGSVEIVCVEEVKEMTFGASLLKCRDLFLRQKEIN